MTQYKSSSDLKDLAKEKLTGKYGIAMFISPILQGILSISALLPAFFVLLSGSIAYTMTGNENSQLGFMVVYLILVILSSLLISVLNVGVVFFNLNLACGRLYRISDIFCGIRYHLGKALALSVMQILVAFVLMIPYVICGVAWSLNPDSLWIIGVCVSAIAYIVIMLYIQLCWSQSYYLLLDFPKTKALELLKLSTKIMKGHKKRLFYIRLSFLPLEFLCICSSYIGYLWYTPYVNMTNTLFFLDIMQPAKTEAVELVEAIKPEITETENASELY